MFTVVLVLTVAFLFLFWLANHYVFRELSTISPPADVHVDSRTFAGAFLVGLAMFATLFLGVVLAVFLTLGVVSADAERGLLQPLVVRPVGRGTLLLSRFLGAGAVCVVYVLGVYFIAMSITGVTGHWWPDQIVWPGVELAAGVLVVIALSLLGSVVLSGTANGIAVFMLFGSGLVAGLLGSIGHALNSHAIKHASTIASWALPFEALYQDGLRMITERTSGLTGFLLQLGPFGGAYVDGWPIRVWAAFYLVAALAAGVLVVIALSLLGSVVLSGTANGIAVFMLFGSGLVAGLLGSIGHALNSHAIKHASTIASWALPFEALYQDGLRMITERTSGLTGFLLQLGPFGGAYVHGWPIRLWAAFYLVAALAAAVALFARKDL